MSCRSSWSRRRSAAAGRHRASSSRSSSRRARTRPPLVRSYSLSGHRGDGRYRIAVKVEPARCRRPHIRRTSASATGWRSRPTRTVHPRRRRAARRARQRRRRRDAAAGDAARAPRRPLDRATSGGSTAHGTAPSTPSPTRRDRCWTTSHVHRRRGYSRPARPTASAPTTTRVGRIARTCSGSGRARSTATTTSADRTRSWTALRDGLVALGVAAARVHTEVFGAQELDHPRRRRRSGATAAPTRGRTGLRTAHLVRADRPRTCAGASGAPTILELAEACDVPVRWSCR